VKNIDSNLCNMVHCSILGKKHFKQLDVGYNYRPILGDQFDKVIKSGTENGRFSVPLLKLDGIYRPCHIGFATLLLNSDRVSVNAA